MWGARRPDQVDPVSEVFAFSLDANAKAEIDRIINEEVKEQIGPEFMAPLEELMPR